jgi:hypothetical protein
LPYQTPASPSHVPEARDVPGEVAMSDSNLSASSPAPKIKLKRIKRTSHIAQYRIAGEMFYVEVRQRKYFMTHPAWSLMGAGKDLEAAEKDLFKNAGIVTRVYGRMDPRTMDDEAQKMYAFALRIA